MSLLGFVPRGCMVAVFVALTTWWVSNATFGWRHCCRDPVHDRVRRGGRAGKTRLQRAPWSPRRPRPRAPPWLLPLPGPPALAATAWKPKFQYSASQQPRGVFGKYGARSTGACAWRVRSRGAAHKFRVQVQATGKTAAKFRFHHPTSGVTEKFGIGECCMDSRCGATALRMMLRRMPAASS